MRYERDPLPPTVVGQTIRLSFGLDDEELGGHNEIDATAFDFQVVAEDGSPVFEDTDVLLSSTRGINRTVELRRTGKHWVQYRLHGGNDDRWDTLEEFDVRRADPNVRNVALVPSAGSDSTQQRLWDFIKDVAHGLRFENYIQRAENEGAAFCATGLGKQEYGKPSYQRLHGFSTHFVNAAALGLRPGENLFRDEVDLSYVSGQGDNESARPFPKDLIDCGYPLKNVPFVELIFVYWMEEAMLFQSLNHIIARFQNRRIGTSPGPLARLAVSPLMPLRGILWSLSEAERERLSVRRRAVEYAYEYGLQLLGRAIPRAEVMVERRTQFLPAFHSLLNAAHHYYKERDDLTVKADAFPLLNGLRELHLVLARGANNQFADLPLTARIETLDVQWMLAQPEMHQFLGGPTMVPYEEPWMDRVDTMKTMFGWADASVTHFYDLAFHGEQLVLSARHGRWNEAGRTGDDAENWALAFRDSVQRYIHAYRAVTGRDLGKQMDTTMPSALLSRQLARQFA